MSPITSGQRGQRFHVEKCAVALGVGMRQVREAALDHWGSDSEPLVREITEISHGVWDR